MYKKKPDLTASPPRLILETRSHPWVPTGHPQNTGAWFAREAVDGPRPNHCAHAAVSEKHLHSRAWLRSHSTTTATTKTQTPRETTQEPSRHVQSGEALVVCTPARLTSTSAQQTRWEDSGDAQTIAETVTNHKQYDTEYRRPTQLTVSRPCRSPSSNPGGN